MTLFLGGYLVPGEIFFAEALVGAGLGWLLVLLQVVDLAGAQGVSTVVALGGAAIFELLHTGSDRRTQRAVVAAALSVGVVFAYGAMRLP